MDARGLHAAVIVARRASAQHEHYWQMVPARMAKPLCGTAKVRILQTSPRQPPCWQRGFLPRWALCPSRMAGLLARRSWHRVPAGLPRLPGVLCDTKRRTIRRKRGVQPRLFVSPLQWLFPPASTSGRPHHAIRRQKYPQAGWKALAAIQSRGRLRSACPAWVQAFAFPFALRPACLPSGNHPRQGLGPGTRQVNHGCGVGLPNSGNQVV